MNLISRISTCFCTCFCLFFSSPLFSQTLDSIGFKRFLQSVLIAHPAVQAAALEQNIARSEMLNAMGGFDPVLKGVYDYKASGGKDPSINYIDAGIEMPINTLFGPKVGVVYDRGLGSSLNNEFRTESDGQVGLNLSIPLWQGIVTDRRRTTFEKARIRPLLANANQQFEQNNLLRSAGLQYWSWAEAAEQLRIAEAVLAISIQRLNFIAARARRGEVAALDSIEALQEVERRRGDMYRSMRGVEQANIDAAVFFWTESGLPRPLSQRPETIPTLARLDANRIQNDRQSALALRPEMQRIDFNEQSTNLDLTLAREFQKPMIETKAEWYYSIGKTNVDNIKLGVNMSVPLLFRSATAQVELFNISLDRINLQRTQTARFVNADIDNALSALQRALERTEAAEREALYATLMEEGERKRFFAGETSLLIVNLRERAAAEARVRVITARADYFRAWTLYHWAVGNIVQLAQ
jgi:outer membrane protein TolC